MRKKLSSIYINDATQKTKDKLLVINDIISPIDDDDKFGLRDALSKPARRLNRKTQTKTLQRYKETLSCRL